MQTITSTHGVNVHANLHELTRIRQQLTVSQLALWGDHSSRIAAMFGLANNDIADIIFNDCGLVVWAIENPELGVAIAAGLTAIWAQLANLNALCDLVESKYQVGELTIDRKMALEHQLFEVAATAPFWAKLGLGGTDGTSHGGATHGGKISKQPQVHPFAWLGQLGWFRSRGWRGSRGWFPRGQCELEGSAWRSRFGGNPRSPNRKCGRTTKF
jgi:hypothetical protein